MSILYLEHISVWISLISSAQWPHVVVADILEGSALDKVVVCLREEEREWDRSLILFFILQLLTDI